MTTGRINQVTIVEASPEGHAGVSTGRGLLSPARPRVAESNRATREADHPFATPEFSQARVRSKRRPVVGLGHIVLGWRLPVAGHAESGYRCAGVPPNASISSLTISQQPTEPSVAAPLNRLKGAGFRASPPPV